MQGELDHCIGAIPDPRTETGSTDLADVALGESLPISWTAIHGWREDTGLAKLSYMRDGKG